MSSALLQCDNLHVSFTLSGKSFEAVRGVSFNLATTETLGIVGESGCGKTMTALSIMRLIPSPPGNITKGEILFNSENLLTLPEQQIRSIRGGKIAMIFQDPMTSLNPVFSCRSQIRESIVQHQITEPEKADALIEQTLAEVGIPDPKRTADSFPHQLSGGMRQRVMIAMALVGQPQLLIADEPTTALDVTVQAKILDLLHKLQQQRSMSMLLITHNLGIVGDIAQKVMVMYAGEIMEFGPVETIFNTPLHPYTINLLETIPSTGVRKERLTVIPGEVPTLQHYPEGCPFHPRCNRATDRCGKEHPELSVPETGRQVRCFYYD